MRTSPTKRGVMAPNLGAVKQPSQHLRTPIRTLSAKDSEPGNPIKVHYLVGAMAHSFTNQEKYQHSAARPSTLEITLNVYLI